MTPDEYAARKAENLSLLNAVLHGSSQKLQLDRKTCSNCGAVLVAHAKPGTFGGFVVRCLPCKQDFYLVRVGRGGARCHRIRPRKMRRSSL